MLSWWVVGTRLRALGNMLHEASHGMLGRHRVLNNALGHVLATIDFTTLASYRAEHLTHHTHLGDESRDLDFASRRPFGFSNPDLPFFEAHVLRPLRLHHLRVYLRPAVWSRGDHWGTCAARIAFIALLVAVAWFVGPVWFLVFYVVPYCTTYQIMRYWSDALDHAGIMDAPQEYYRARNHLLPWRFLELVVFPRNDAFHLVHHLFPAVPTEHQPAVHTLLLAREPSYAARQHALLPLLGIRGRDGYTVGAPPQIPDERVGGTTVGDDAAVAAAIVVPSSLALSAERSAPPFVAATGDDGDVVQKHNSARFS